MRACPPSHSISLQHGRGTIRSCGSLCGSRESPFPAGSGGGGGAISTGRWAGRQRAPLATQLTAQSLLALIFELFSRAWLQAEVPRSALGRSVPPRWMGTAGRLASSWPWPPQSAIAARARRHPCGVPPSARHHRARVPLQHPPPLRRHQPPHKVSGRVLCGRVDLLCSLACCRSAAHSCVYLKRLAALPCLSRHRRVRHGAGGCRPVGRRPEELPWL